MDQKRKTKIEVINKCDPSDQEIFFFLLLNMHIHALSNFPTFRPSRWVWN